MPLLSGAIAAAVIVIVASGSTVLAGDAGVPAAKDEAPAKPPAAAPAPSTAPSGARAGATSEKKKAPARDRAERKKPSRRDACLAKCRQLDRHRDCADADGHLVNCPCHCP